MKITKKEIESLEYVIESLKDVANYLERERAYHRVLGSGSDKCLRENASILSDILLKLQVGEGV
jgi:hypothetical protein